MKKTYETPTLELTVFQSCEQITQSIAGQAMFGFFDDNDRQRTRE